MDMKKKVKYIKNLITTTLSELCHQTTQTKQQATKPKHIKLATTSQWHLPTIDIIFTIIPTLLYYLSSTTTNLLATPDTR